MRRLTRMSRTLIHVVVGVYLVQFPAMSLAAASQLVQVPFGGFGDSANALPLSTVFGPTRAISKFTPPRRSQSMELSTRLCSETTNMEHGSSSSPTRCLLKPVHDDQRP